MNVVDVTETRFGAVSVNSFPESRFSEADAERNLNAIQRALDFVSLGRWQGGEQTAVDPHLAEALASQATVYFPPGIYIIKGSLRVGGFLRGENNSIIVQIEPVPTLKVPAHVMIDNLAFLYGSRAIEHSFERPKDSPDSQIIIQNCEFHKTSDFAIYTHNANNTVLTIRDCKFMQCKKVFRNNCNLAYFEGCYVKTDWHMLEAAFENRGGLSIRKVFGIGNGSTCQGAEPRWIDNYGSLHMQECALGAHGGPGLASIVRNFVRANPASPTAVSIVNSGLDAGPSERRSSVIYLASSAQLREGEDPSMAQLPNIIEVVGNGVTPGMRPIKVDPNLDLGRLNKRYNYQDIRITISGNVPSFDINAIEQYEKLITFLNPDLFESAARHSDNVSNYFTAQKTYYKPGEGWSSDGVNANVDALLPNQEFAANVLGPVGMLATRFRRAQSSVNRFIYLKSALDFVTEHIERQKQPPGGIYTLSVFVRTHKAKVALTAFGKPITAFKISPLWSRISGSFYFDGVLPDPRGDTTSLGLNFAFDDLDDPSGFVDVCGFSLNEGHIPSPYVFPGNNWIVTSPEGAPVYWGTAPPQGTWRQGDIVYNSTPTAGSFIGWVRVPGSNPQDPGEWRPFGKIE